MEAREQITRLVQESPSLRDYPAVVAEDYPPRRRKAEAETVWAGYPGSCPWTIDQLLDHAFWPPEGHACELHEVAAGDRGLAATSRSPEISRVMPEVEPGEANLPPECDSGGSRRDAQNVRREAVRSVVATASLGVMSPVVPAMHKRRAMREMKVGW